MAIVRDEALFHLVRSAGPALVASGFTTAGGPEVLDASIRLMLEELAANAYEDRGFERLVDFGHTFSPILEEVSGYTLRHGEAVALDMAVSSAVGVTLGILPEAELQAVVAALREVGLPVLSPLCSTATLSRGLAAATAHRDGDLNLVVPERIGHARFVKSLDDVPPGVLDVSLALLARVAAG